MAVLSIAEKIYTAYLTGDEAEFDSNGVRYEFTPEGLRDFITSGIPQGVSSVNGMYGDVALTASDVDALPDTYAPTWAQVTDKPATFAPTIGTTATTAKAGNYQPTWAQVTGKPTTFAPTPGVAVADAVDETDIVSQFNALLTSLRASGAIAT